MPSIMIMVADDTYDVSILMNSSAEEEKHAKDFELKLPLEATVENVIDFNGNKLLVNHSENYSSLFKELNSPPPEPLF